MCETYSGFTNWRTYCVHQWLNNDDQATWQTAVAVVNNEESIDEGARALQAHVEEESPLYEESGLYAELLQDALETVNWRELAESLWDEALHEDEDELDDDEYDEEYDRMGDFPDESEDAHE